MLLVRFSPLLALLYTLGGLFSPTFAQTLTQGFALGAGGNDLVEAIAVTPAGETYMTGSFVSTVDFDPSANAANALAAGSGDAFLAKYSSAGALLWVRTFGGTGYDQGKVLSLDALGNIYVGGAFEASMDADPSAGTTLLSSNGATDAFLAKYKSDGSFVWAFSFGSTLADEVTGLAAYSGDHLYATGRFNGTVDFDAGPGTTSLTSNGGYDWFLAQYLPDGKLGFVQQTGTSSNEAGPAVAVDNSSNVYVAGAFTSGTDFDPGPGTQTLALTGFSDAFLVKYNKLGAYQWGIPIGGMGFLGNEARAVACDAGHVYVTGRFSGTADFDPSASVASRTAGGFQSGFVARYTLAGVYKWATDLSASGFGIVTPLSLSLDNANGLYLGGDFNVATDFDPGPGLATRSPVDGVDGFVARYSAASGAYEWAFGLGGTGTDRALAVAAAGTGVQAAGTFANSLDLDPQATTSSLSSQGNSDIWTSHYSASSLPVVWAYFEAAPGPMGIDLRWGTAQEIATDYFMIERSQDGYLFEPLDAVPAQGYRDALSRYQFTDPAPRPGLNHYRLRQVDLDGAFSYSQTQTAQLGTPQLSLTLYPNPTHDDLHLHLSGLSTTSAAPEVSVYNAAGLQVQSLPLTGRFTARLSLASLPPGLYYVQVRVGETRLSQAVYRSGP